jgi:hypothetical protein
MKHLLFTLLLLVCAYFLHAQSYQAILPNATDAAIDSYTSAANNEYHTVYFQEGSKKKNLLFVFLPGTGGIPAGYDSICATAANLGYHAIGLMYPNTPAIGTLCQPNKDSLCFEKTRLEIIDGKDRSPLLSVNRANSIENRLIKLLLYLQTQQPAQNWKQFLDANGELIWNKIAIAGHSQGGGHVGIIAQNHVVNRAIFFASPKDYNAIYKKNGAWMYQPHATPTSAYYGFSHNLDDLGCTVEQQFDAFRIMGMGVFGKIVDVYTKQAPYSNSRMLTSTADCSNTHNCVVVDAGRTPVPIYLKNAWIYLLNGNAATTATKEPVRVESIPFHIWPNPTQNWLNIEFKDGFNPTDMTWRIMDLSGKTITQGLFSESTNPIKLPTLANGMYFFQLYSAEKSATAKVIIQN